MVKKGAEEILRYAVRLSALEIEVPIGNEVIRQLNAMCGDCDRKGWCRQRRVQRWHLFTNEWLNHVSKN